MLSGPGEQQKRHRRTQTPHGSTQAQKCFIRCQVSWLGLILLRTPFRLAAVASLSVRPPYSYWDSPEISSGSLDAFHIGASRHNCVSDLIPQYFIRFFPDCNSFFTQREFSGRNAPATDFARESGYDAAMRVIYADSVLATNIAVDYVLLLAAGKFCGAPLRRRRMGLGAAWGGVYALCAAIRPGLFALWTVKLAAGAAAVLIAYGAERRTLRVLGAFYGIAAAFGGAVYAAAALRGESVTGRYSLPLPLLLAGFALCYGLVSIVFRCRGREGRRIRRVTVALNGRRTEFSALEDSGNELTDPLTGCGVLVAESGVLAPLFEDPGLPDLPAAEALAAGTAGQLRLLPCRCVTAESGLLLCFRPEMLTVDGTVRRDLLVAVSRTKLSGTGEYQGVIPV